MLPDWSNKCKYNRTVQKSLTNGKPHMRSLQHHMCAVWFRCPVAKKNGIFFWLVEFKGDHSPQKKSKNTGGGGQHSWFTCRKPVNEATHHTSTRPAKAFEVEWSIRVSEFRVFTGKGPTPCCNLSPEDPEIKGQPFGAIPKTDQWEKPKIKKSFRFGQRSNVSKHLRILA